MAALIEVKPWKERGAVRSVVTKSPAVSSSRMTSADPRHTGISGFVMTRANLSGGNFGGRRISERTEMKGYKTEDLIKIAAAGGGFVLEATGFQLNDLVRIASAAASTQARITIRGTHLPTDQMIQIAAAGRGVVVFEQ